MTHLLKFIAFLLRLTERTKRIRNEHLIVVVPSIDCRIYAIAFSTTSIQKLLRQIPVTAKLLALAILGSRLLSLRHFLLAIVHLSFPLQSLVHLARMAPRLQTLHSERTLQLLNGKKGHAATCCLVTSGL